MRAKQVMTRQIHTVAANASVYEAAQVMLNAGISAAPVVDVDGALIGIVSEADLMYRSEIGTAPGKSWLQRLLSDDAVLANDYIRAHSHRVADVMTKNLVTADEGATLGEIATLMQRHRVKRIPIVRDGKVVGIESRANLLQGLLAR
jgi:CBS domain-containing protein